MVRPTVHYEDRKFLKKEEIEKILSAIIIHSTRSLVLRRNLIIFYLFLYCGLRKEELLQLQIRDIDLERKLLTVRSATSKVSRTRYIPLHSQLVLCLKEYLNERKKYTTPHLLVSSIGDVRFYRFRNETSYCQSRRAIGGTVSLVPVSTHVCGKFP
jgi:integrase/recombinase XerD